MKAVFCIHCGRIYIVDDKHGLPDDQCVCGSEIHPVAKDVLLGEELKLGDGHEARVIVQALDKCDVCGTCDRGNQMGWGIRGTTLYCPKCLSRVRA